MSNSSTPKKTEKTIKERLYDAVPDGKTVTFEEFKKSVGDDIAQLLVWASPKKLSRKGEHVTMEADAPASTVAGKHTIKTAKKVEFDVDSSNTSALAAKNIDGVKVSTNLGTYPIVKCKMTVDADGNTNIDGTVKAGWFTVPFNQKLDKDGNPIDE